MKVTAVAAEVFDDVGEGVAVVEHGTDPLFGFVLIDDPRFELHASSDRLFEVGVIVQVMIFQPAKEVGIKHHRHFDNLRHPGGKLPFGQGFKPRRVDIDGTGLVESAHEIFAVAVVDAGFASDAGVDLG